METKKEIIIVGPRVLISPDTGEGKTKAGLYLPPTVIEKDDVMGGLIINTGPGYPVLDLSYSEEPWSEKKNATYVPLQACKGDYALFIKKDAIEIEYEYKKYLIVPHTSILALIRTEII